MNAVPVRWGVLGVAKIGMERVVPAALESPRVEVSAIASRSIDKAKAAAAKLGIPRAYGSYEEILADPEIEAVYIPLPNNLHVEWTLRAIEAGKHVLCEKPLALVTSEIASIEQAAARHGVLAMEAFMVFSQPRIQALRDLIRGGTIGRLKTIRVSFSNPNLDPGNIRNKVETGGGALWDKGCYAVALARYLFEAEPEAVTAACEIHPDFGIDTITSGILQFAGGLCSFDCSSEIAIHQQLVAIGTDGHIELDIPVTPSPADGTAIRITNRDGARTVQFEPCNQYRLMIEAMSAAIRQQGDLPVSAAFSTGNARVIEALFKAAAERRWI